MVVMMLLLQWSSSDVCSRRARARSLSIDVSGISRLGFLCCDRETGRPVRVIVTGQAGIGGDAAS